MSLDFTVRRGAYFDSVVLMRVAEQARQLAGVTEVAAVMGTPANRAMLAEAGMLPPDAPATDASDLLVVVSASSGEAARAAQVRVGELLAHPLERRPHRAVGGRADRDHEIGRVRRRRVGGEQPRFGQHRAVGRRAHDHRDLQHAREPARVLGHAHERDRIEIATVSDREPQSHLRRMVSEATEDGQTGGGRL